MTTTHDTPTAVITGATVWYRDDIETEVTTRCEDVKVTLYDSWAKIDVRPGSAVWVPREGVEQIHD
jgi:hypothetical protein